MGDADEELDAWADDGERDDWLDAEVGTDCALGELDREDVDEEDPFGIDAKQNGRKRARADDIAQEEWNACMRARTKAMSEAIGARHEVAETKRVAEAKLAALERQCGRAHGEEAVLAQLELEELERLQSYQQQALVRIGKKIEEKRTHRPIPTPQMSAILSVAHAELVEGLRLRCGRARSEAVPRVLG